MKNPQSGTEGLEQNERPEGWVVDGPGTGDGPHSLIMIQQWPSKKKKKWYIDLFEYVIVFLFYTH